MYTEFFLPIIDYFRILKNKTSEIIFEWIIPFIISLLIFIYPPIEFFNLKSYLFELICIMLGVSMAIITVLITGGFNNIERIKNYITNTKINDKNISLYKLLMINYIYSIIIELFIVFFCILGFVFKTNNEIIIKVSHCILCFFVLHIILITIKNMTNLYLIVSYDDKTKKNE